MFVFGAVVVVEVEGGDAGFQEFEGFVGGVGGGEVGVAEVEGDADVGEVAGGEDFEEMFGGGDFVSNFREGLYAEWVGEGLEVFDGGEGVFEGAEVPGIVLEAEVEGGAVKGICSAESRARLTSSMASMRRDFSGSMRLMFGATWRDHWPFRGREVDGLVEGGRVPVSRNQVAMSRTAERSV